MEQPGPKAALEGLGAMLQAQAQITVAAEQHQHEQTVLAAKNAHEQLLEDKRNAEAQRVRDAGKNSREQWLGVVFLFALVFIGIGAGALVHAGWLDKTAAGVGALFFATVLQSIFAQAKRL